MRNFSRPHPLSTEAAVASLKRYIAEPRYQIRLSDLIEKTVEQLIQVTSGEAFGVDGPDPTNESITARVRGYEAACSTLLAMAPVGGRWAKEEHYQVWQRALQRVGSTTVTGGFQDWIGLKKYPATLLLYALGLGAVEADQLRFLKHILATTLRDEFREEDMPAVQALSPSRLSVSRQELKIHETLRPHAECIIPDKNRYTLVFDKLEILMALNYAYITKRLPELFWPYPATFGFRHYNRTRIVQEIEESLSTMKTESPYVKSGIFGDNFEACQQGVEDLRRFIPR